ncbi:hypothetical protein [Pseudomonas simiae]|uniref:hypothetical protein n=1 Tax=Pseudomonas simiae TaxID=321846 RepID=UPI00094413B4
MPTCWVASVLVTASSVRDRRLAERVADLSDQRTAAVLMLLILGVVYPWSNGNGGVPRFAEDVRTAAP